MGGVNSSGVHSPRLSYNAFLFSLFLVMQLSGPAPQPKPLVSATLTKHGQRFCQTQDKHSQRGRDGTKKGGGGDVT